MRRTLYSLALLLAIVLGGALAAAAWLLTTTEGARWVGARVPGLSLRIEGGDLWRGLQVRELTWQQDAQRVRLERLRTRWDPGCLWERRLCVQELGAALVSVELPPGGEPPPVPEPLRLPELRLPLAVELDALRVARIEVNQGETSVVLNDLAASARLGESGLEVQTLRLAHELGELELSGKLGLDAGFALDAELRARFPALLEGADVELSARLGGSLERLRLDAELSGALAARLGGELQPLLARPAYDLALRWTRLAWPPGAAQVSLREGSLALAGDTGRYELTLGTRIDLPELQDADLQLRASGDTALLRVKELALRHGRAIVRTTGELGFAPDVRWQGPLTLVRLDLAPWVAQSQSPLRGHAQLDARVAGGGWRVELSELRLEGRFLDQAVGVKGRLSGSDQGRWETPGLTVSAAGNRLTASGWVTPAAPAGQDAYRVEVGWERLAWPLPGGRELRSPGGQLVAGGALGSAVSYRVEGGAQLEVSDLPPARVEVAASGDTSRVEVGRLAVHTLGGVVSAAGGLELGEAPAWRGTLDLERIDLARLDLAALLGGEAPSLDGELNGRVVAAGEFAAAGPAVRVESLRIEGRVRDRPLTVEARGALEPSGDWIIEQGEVLSGDNRVSVSGGLGAEWSLAGEARLSDLSAFMEALGGDLRADFSLNGPVLAPDVRLAARGSELRYGERSLQSLEVDVELVALGEAASRATVRAAGLRDAGDLVETLELRATGSRARHSVVAQARGALLSLDATLEGETTNQDWQGVLAPARVSVRGSDWELDGPLTFARSDVQHRMRVPAHCWTQQAARLCLTRAVELDEAGEAVIALEGFDIRTLAAYLPEGTVAEGALEAQARLAWSSVAALRVDLDAGLDDATLTRRAASEDDEDLRLAVRRVSLTAALRGEALEAALSLDANEFGTLEAEARVGLGGEQSLGGQVRLVGLQVAAAQAFFPRLGTLAGQVSADGRLGGTLTRPTFTGDIRARGLALAAPDLPVALSDGAVDIAVDGTRATFSATAASADGSLAVNGEALWGDDPWSVRLRVSGSDIPVRQLPLLNAIAEPQIDFAIRPGVIELSGELRVPYARITLREIPEGATSLSSDVVLADAPPAEQPGGWKIVSRVRLVLGDDVRFEGLGLVARLAGTVDLEQADNAVVTANGEIRVTEGTYKAYGQNLRITEGRLLFVGLLERPNVNLNAVRQVGSVTAGLHLRGPLAEPTVTLFSQPPQTETNTLSYIVLGRPLDTRGEDANVLAQAALALGVRGGSGIATRVASQLGVQDFEITAEGDADAGPQVVLRGRLAPNLAVSYGVGVLTPENTLTLHYDLTESLYVEVAQGVASALDLFYSFGF